MSQHPHLGVVGDVISGAAVIGTLAGYLPYIAALGAVIWYAIQIYDRLFNHRGADD